MWGGAYLISSRTFLLPYLLPFLQSWLWFSSLAAALQYRVAILKIGLLFYAAGCRSAPRSPFCSAGCCYADTWPSRLPHGSRVSFLSFPETPWLLYRGLSSFVSRSMSSTSSSVLPRKYKGSRKNSRDNQSTPVGLQRKVPGTYCKTWLLLLSSQVVLKSSEHTSVPEYRRAPEEINKKTLEYTTGSQSQNRNLSRIESFSTSRILGVHPLPRIRIFTLFFPNQNSLQILGIELNSTPQKLDCTLILGIDFCLDLRRIRLLSRTPENRIALLSSRL